MTAQWIVAERLSLPVKVVKVGGLPAEIRRELLIGQTEPALSVGFDDEAPDQSAALWKIPENGWVPSINS